MSVAETALVERAARTVVDRLELLAALVASLVGAVVASGRAAAFWLATLLPLSYPPLLASGVTADHRLGFVALLGANGVAFVLGHGHRRTER
jgi:hypothetical protein